MLTQNDIKEQNNQPKHSILFVSYNILIQFFLTYTEIYVLSATEKLAGTQYAFITSFYIYDFLMTLKRQNDVAFCPKLGQILRLKVERPNIFIQISDTV